MNIRNVSAPSPEVCFGHKQVEEGASNSDLSAWYGVKKERAFKCCLLEITKVEKLVVRSGKNLLSNLI